MPKKHVMSALIRKHGELSGIIDYHRLEIEQIKKQMDSIGGAIKVFDPDFDLRKIPSKKYQAKNKFFEPREGNTLLMEIFRDTQGPISTGKLIDEVIERKEFERDEIDYKALRASLFVILKRLQNSGVIEEPSRDGLEINWGLV